MVVIGLTGGMGAGKSTFAGFLAELGAIVVDVDDIGRAVIAPDGPGAGMVLDRFGTLERAGIAKVVFADEAARRELEAISWPLIEDEIQRRLDDGQPDDVVVLDMAVLPQGLARGLYGPVITVEAPESVRIQRLVGRGLTEEDAVARMRSQLPEIARRALADLVIENRGDLDTLRTAAVRTFATFHRG